MRILSNEGNKLIISECYKSKKPSLMSKLGFIIQKINN